tara:strand:- start:190 stop:627 length:438 start_codon:yes stop_codon:yes gene_type:complete
LDLERTKVVRFNHCDNVHLFNGRTDLLVLNSKGQHAFPHGVDGDGRLICKAYQNTTTIIRNYPSLASKYVPASAMYATAKCPVSKCSVGLETIHQLLFYNVSNVMLIGFSNHQEDQWNVSWHDFREERRIVNALAKESKIMRIPC